MKLRCTTLVLVVALALQGFAGTCAVLAAVPGDAAALAAVPHLMNHGSCCPKAHHPVNCCADAILATAPAWSADIRDGGRPAAVFSRLAARFSSHGDAPLVRPPIA